MIHKIIFLESDGKTNKAMFIDRDGVINRKPQKHDYVKDWKEFVFNQKVFSILIEAQRQGFFMIVVTNQRGVSKKLFTKEKFEKISQNMVKKMGEKGVNVSAVYYCPHRKNSCICRKPKPGLVLSAIKDYMIDPSKSIMIGDSDSDMEAGRRAGIKRLYKIKVNFDNEDVSALKKKIFKD